MKLLLITQVVDTEHPVLGFFHAWIAELAKHFEVIEVIALQVGSYDLPSNVHVHSLGKEEGTSRLVRLSRLVRFARTLEYDRVLVHMNVEYLIVLGWYWMLKGIPTFLWYVHKSVSLRLRLALFFVSRVFSTDASSFRISSSKVVFVGHGVPPFRSTPISHTGCVALAVGRVSQTKCTGELMEVVTECEDVTLEVIGAPATTKDEVYMTSLMERGQKNVSFVGGVPHTQIGAHYARADILLHMSRTGSTDKVVLEAMRARILPISSSPAFQEVLTPHGLFVASGEVEDMRSALKRVCALEDTERTRIADALEAYVDQNHSLERLMLRISNEMKAYV